MRLYRIAREAYPGFDGEGARIEGGRWNSPGVPVVYTAESRALAALERLAWTDPAAVPKDLRLYEIELDDPVDLEVVPLGVVPSAWLDPDHPFCREMGNRWIQSQRSLVLQVPSSIIPEEANFLLNPVHPASAGIRIRASRRFRFDARLLKRHPNADHAGRIARDPEHPDRSSRSVRRRRGPRIAMIRPRKTKRAAAWAARFRIHRS